MERRSKRPRRRGRKLWFLAALAVLAGLFVYWDNTALQAASFSPALPDLPQGFDGCRVVVLGDLHSTYFGEDNEKLLEAVGAQEPEYIFLVGDLLDAFRDVPEGYAKETAAGLTAIAPTYYVTGNHEWALGDVRSLKKTLEAQGVTVLSNEFVTLERNGDAVILAGIDDPNGYAHPAPGDQPERGDRGGGGPGRLGEPLLDAAGPPERPLPGAVQPPGGGPGDFGPRPRRGHPPALHRRAGVHGPDLLPLLHGGAVRGKRLRAVRHPGLGNSGSTFRLFNRPEVAVVTLRRG